MSVRALFGVVLGTAMFIVGAVVALGTVFSSKASALVEVGIWASVIGFSVAVYFLLPQPRRDRLARFFTRKFPS